jgi:hypothetical protein
MVRFRLIFTQMVDGAPMNPVNGPVDVIAPIVDEAVAALIADPLPNPAVALIHVYFCA